MSLDFVEGGLSQPFSLPGSLGATLRGYLYGFSRRKREGARRKEVLLEQADEMAAQELRCLERAERARGMLRELADFMEFAGELSWESPA